MANKIRDEHGNVYVQKKPFYKRIWFIVLVGLFVISGLQSVLGGGSNSSTSSNQATSTTSQTTTETSASSSEKSKEVPVGDVVYLVNSKEVSTNVGGEFGKTANGVFLVLNVTVKNNGKEAITVTDDFFTLLKGDVEYKSDSTAGIYANQDAKFFFTEVNPENAITGNVVFDITEETANDPSIQLRVQTGFWGTETGVINLQ
ncbi:TPA: DUF4352 domain-containing protein [Streptococcus suis]|uniref:DUF4352 domain-containing protein n=1 Tax=Streptococcus suis TaxID=1307 RepID=UPI001554D42C|nr:DUF4352 domain-containing protein [Streptococcus suis]MDY7333437.1 DUF4352 domain-containing protein [Streptococcus suis]NQO75053.1 DUF4352 domain-containing protein [Streptococcus suis]NQP41110.1 DUF4352 domain-containing protein [Streptococcus suis]HEL2149872.1 DUF4352 domain-containing protein [Streptococcus suis]HEM3868699.1 DUF4352 domain-containing protein [Streptococcus suis]